MTPSAKTRPNMTLPKTGSPDVNAHLILSKFPTEIWDMVDRLLSNRDIKQLRLTCKLLLERVGLRLERVFLSRSRLNIDVFLSIAKHKTFRHQVKEIIYDSSLLVGHDTDYEPDDPDNAGQTRSLDDTLRLFVWSLTDNYAKAQWYLDLLIGRDTDELVEYRRRLLGFVAQGKRGLSTEMLGHWDHLGACIRDQDVICDPGSKYFKADFRALCYGLRRFPELQKITVTTEAYGQAPVPKYMTPVMRAFPPNFNYPWLKSDLHGVDVALEALAKNGNRHRIELVVEQNRITNTLIGFGPDTLDEAGTEAAPSSPGPSSQSMSLPVTIYVYPEDFALSLRRATDKAEKLYVKPMAWEAEFCHKDRVDDKILEPIQSLSSFQRLEHLRLFGTPITVDSLVALLSALPDSLRTVELMSLSLCDGSFSDLLQGVKDKSGWSDRPRRPSLRIEVPHRMPSCTHWVEAEVNSFLYDGGRDPLHETECRAFSLHV